MLNFQATSQIRRIDARNSLELHPGDAPVAAAENGARTVDPISTSVKSASFICWSSNVSTQSRDAGAEFSNAIVYDWPRPNSGGLKELSARMLRKERASMEYGIAG